MLSIFAREEDALHHRSQETTSGDNSATSALCAAYATAQCLPIFRSCCISTLQIRSHYIIAQWPDSDRAALAGTRWQRFQARLLITACAAVNASGRLPYALSAMAVACSFLPSRSPRCGDVRSQAPSQSFHSSTLTQLTSSPSHSTPSPSHGLTALTEGDNDRPQPSTGFDPHSCVRARTGNGTRISFRPSLTFYSHPS